MNKGTTKALEMAQLFLKQSRKRCKRGEKIRKEMKLYSSETKMPCL